MYSLKPGGPGSSLWTNIGPLSDGDQITLTGSVLSSAKLERTHSQRVAMVSGVAVSKGFEALPDV